MRNIPKLTLILLFAVFGKALADHSELSVKLDTEEVPHLTNWGGGSATCRETLVSSDS